MEVCIIARAWCCDYVVCREEVRSRDRLCRLASAGVMPSLETSHSIDIGIGHLLCEVVDGRTACRQTVCMLWPGQPHEGHVGINRKLAELGPLFNVIA